MKRLAFFLLFVILLGGLGTGLVGCRNEPQPEQKNEQKPPEKTPDGKPIEKPIS